MCRGLPPLSLVTSTSTVLLETYYYCLAVLSGKGSRTSTYRHWSNPRQCLVWFGFDLYALIGSLCSEQGSYKRCLKKTNCSFLKFRFRKIDVTQLVWPRPSCPRSEASITVFCTVLPSKLTELWPFC